ncbi:hypothetical protein PInf_004343 [Phytophthora infestans]|nr:hypothetical protein PInf_027620 [Phytophthora infestans]KAI9985036.1 hypothetical protein PInf_004343 [Phytophthora infestans]
MGGSGNKDRYKKLREVVEKESSDSSEGAPRPQDSAADVCFWLAMRDVLAINEGTVGMGILDEIAAAIIQGSGKASDALTGPVMILPSPSRQHARGQPPQDRRFARVSLPAPQSARPGSGKKKTQGSQGTSLQGRKDRSSPPFDLPFELADRTPPRVRHDLEKIYQEAVLLGLEPFQLVFPWRGSVLWYSPFDFSLVHVAHWRFWNRNRARFWDWQINAPLKNSSARRKAKMLALVARVRFLSVFIETWVYYGFLELVERCTSRRRLMWMGGQPGRNTPDAKSYRGPVIDSLTRLYQHDQEIYVRRIRGALKPFGIDEGGFATMTELLFHTGALDPNSAKADSQLSDRALARVLHDVKSKAKHAYHWVGDLSDKVWHALTHCPRLKKLEVKIARELRDGTLKAPRIAPFDSSEADQDGYASFERTNGAFTASWAEVEEEDAESEEVESENEDDGPDGVDGKDARGHESSSDEGGAGGKRPVKRQHLSRSPPPKSKKSAKRSTSRSRSPRRSYKRKSRSRSRERSLTPERPPFPKRARGKRKASISYSERSQEVPTHTDAQHPSQSRSRSASPEKKKSRRTLSPKRPASQSKSSTKRDSAQATRRRSASQSPPSKEKGAAETASSKRSKSRSCSASPAKKTRRTHSPKQTKNVSSPQRSPHRSLSPPPEAKKPEESPDKQAAEAPSAAKKTSESPEERAESHSPSPKKATVSPDDDERPEIPRSSSKSPPSKTSA